MRRLAALVVAGFLVLSTFAVGSFMPVTHATEVWCEDDPPISVNGVNVGINVGVMPNAAGHIAGTVQVVVVVPEDAVTTGAGPSAAMFSNGSVKISGTVNVTFVEQGNGGNHVTVYAYVPGNSSFGTKLSDTRNSQTDISTSNHIMSVGFSLGGH